MVIQSHANKHTSPEQLGWRIGPAFPPDHINFDPGCDQYMLLLEHLLAEHVSLRPAST